MNEELDALADKAMIALAVCGAAAALAVAVSLPVGVYLKSRNDARHVEQMQRQAIAQERIADALDRAHPGVTPRKGDVLFGKVWTGEQYVPCIDEHAEPVACRK